MSILVSSIMGGTDIIVGSGIGTLTMISSGLIISGSSITYGYDIRATLSV